MPATIRASEHYCRVSGLWDLCSKDPSSTSLEAVLGHGVESIRILQKVAWAFSPRYAYVPGWIEISQLTDLLCLDYRAAQSLHFVRSCRPRSDQGEQLIVCFVHLRRDATCTILAGDHNTQTTVPQASSPISCAHLLRSQHHRVRV